MRFQSYQKIIIIINEHKNSGIGNRIKINKIGNRNSENVKDQLRYTEHWIGDPPNIMHEPERNCHQIVLKLINNHIPYQSPHLNINELQLLLDTRS